MSIFSEGMKKGAEPFVEFNKKQADDLRQRDQDLKERIDDLREVMEEVIDLIEIPKEQRGEFIKQLNERRKRNTLHNYSINVFFKNEDRKYAENIRQSLANLGHAPTLIEFRKKANPADYSVYIGNLNDMAKGVVLYQAFGITISKRDTVILIENDPSANLDKERFVHYYEAIVGAFVGVNKEKRSVSKSAEKAKKEAMKKNHFNVNGEFSDGLADGILNTTMMTLDGIDKALPDWLMPVKLLGFAASGALGLASTVLTLPVFISEVVVSGIRDALNDGNFSKVYVNEAQKQIAEVKLVEYFTKIR